MKINLKMMNSTAKANAQFEHAFFPEIEENEGLEDKDKVAFICRWRPLIDSIENMRNSDGNSIRALIEESVVRVCNLTDIDDKPITTIQEFLSLTGAMGASDNIFPRLFGELVKHLTQDEALTEKEVKN